MKIGVALSGCDIGGVSAHHVLEEIARSGFSPGLISTTSLPSPTALAYAMGLEQAQTDKLAEDFLRLSEEDMDGAISRFADALSAAEATGETIPIAINAHDLAANRAVAFTRAFSLESASFCSRPLGRPYEMLSACVRGVSGLCSFRLGPHLLCDYSAKHGCPVEAARLTGHKKVLSIAFLSSRPSCAFEAVMRQSLRHCPKADLHIPLLMPDDRRLAGYIDFSVTKVREVLSREWEKLVF